MLLFGCWPHVERLTAANLAAVAAPAAAALTGVVIGLHGRFRSTNGTAVANGIAIVFICTHLDRRLPSNSIIVCFVSAQQCSSPILTDVLCHLFVQRTYFFCASTIRGRQLYWCQIACCKPLRVAHLMTLGYVSVGDRAAEPISTRLTLKWPAARWATTFHRQRRFECASCAERGFQILSAYVRNSSPL